MTVQVLIDLLSDCRRDSTVYTFDNKGDQTDRFHLVVDDIVLSLEELPKPDTAIDGRMD